MTDIRQDEIRTKARGLLERLGKLDEIDALLPKAKKGDAEATKKAADLYEEVGRPDKADALLGRFEWEAGPSAPADQEDDLELVKQVASELSDPGEFLVTVRLEDGPVPLRVSKVKQLSRSARTGKFVRRGKPSHRTSGDTTWSVVVSADGERSVYERSITADAYPADDGGNTPVASGPHRQPPDWSAASDSP